MGVVVVVAVEITQITSTNFIVKTSWLKVSNIVV